MRNAFKQFAFAVSVIVVCLLGCSGPSGVQSAPVSFVTDYAPIEFTFPAGWYKNPDEHPYDLQCLSPMQRMNTGVFVYNSIDIATNSSPMDIFKIQIEDLKSKRDNWEEFQPLQNYEDADKKITSIAYLGDRDSSRNCYRFSLIEFKQDDSKIAVVLQVSIPGDWERAEPVLDAITKSAKPLPDNSSTES